MFSELLYLAVGFGKRVDKIIDSVIEEGKKELADKSIVDIPKEHFKKRKEMFKDMVTSDVKKIADELGLATKDDIEDLKKIILQKS